jgi:3-phenylpropionate/cinnamic acid dioxygenase small subunit
MGLTQQEIADRIEIQDLMVRYARAIDTKDYGLLDTCFMPDAHVDYVSSGGTKGPYPEVRAWLEKALAPFPAMMHLVANNQVELNGDQANSRTYVINPMGFPNKDGSLHVFTVAAHYVDKLVRTPDGWRIAERIEETVLMDGGLPEALQIPQ